MAKRTSKLVTMCTLTFILFLAEIIVGYLVSSLALVADAFHMLSDLLSIVIALVAIRMSKKNRTDSMTYGWVRAEILGGLFNGILLLSLCFNILIEAITRFFEPQEITQPVLLLIVASIGLLFNIIGLFVFSGHASHGHSHGHGHSHAKKKEEEVADPDKDIVSLEVGKAENPVAEKQTSSTLHSVFLHVLGDALGSVAVIASALFIWLTDFSWRFYVDPLISVILSLILVRSAVRLVLSSSLILLQRAPHDVNAVEIKEALLQLDGVLGVHELHMWQLDDRRSISTVHIACSDSVQFSPLAVKIKEILHSFGVHNTTIQPEFKSESNVPGDVNECELMCTENMCKQRVCCTAETEAH